MLRDAAQQTSTLKNVADDHSTTDEDGIASSDDEGVEIPPIQLELSEV